MSGGEGRTRRSSVVARGADRQIVAAVLEPAGGRRRGARRRAVGAGVLIAAVLGAAGCGHGVSRQHTADLLGGQVWPVGSVTVDGTTDGGRFPRPSIITLSDSGATPARAVAGAVDDAVAAGWIPVYARCAGPDDEVVVHVVRRLEEGAVAVATIAAADPAVLRHEGIGVGRPGGQDGPRTVVRISAVSSAPEDLDDDAFIPAVLRDGGPGPGAGIDLDDCLAPAAQEPGAVAPRWIGTPAVLPREGGPLPAR